MLIKLIGARKNAGSYKYTAYINSNSIVDFNSQDGVTVISLINNTVYTMDGLKAADLAKIIATAENTKTVTLE